MLCGYGSPEKVERSSGEGESLGVLCMAMGGWSGGCVVACGRPWWGLGRRGAVGQGGGEAPADGRMQEGGFGHGNVCRGEREVVSERE